MSDKEEDYHTFPTVVAFNNNQKKDKNTKTIFEVGENAQKRVRKGKKQTKDEDIWSLRYPIQRGLIMDWEQLEAIISHAFSLVNVKDPSMYPVVIGLAGIFMPNDQIESVAELMFEIFKVKHLSIELPSVLTFRNTQSTTGLAVESGSSLTYVTPIVDGKIHYQLTRKFPVAGLDLTKFVVSQLSRSGYALDPTDEYRIAQHVKTEMAYVCANLKAEFELLQKQPEEFLQDLEIGNDKLTLDKECFLVPEVLFEPSLAGIVGEVGLPDLIVDLAQQVAGKDLKVLNNLLSNVVLGGGNTCFNSLQQRMVAELNDCVKRRGLKANVKVILPRNDPYSAVVGAAMYAEKNISEISWLTRAEYKQNGVAKLFK